VSEIAAIAMARSSDERNGEEEEEEGEEESFWLWLLQQGRDLSAEKCFLAWYLYLHQKLQINA
jgi:hypothetical protein